MSQLLLHYLLRGGESTVSLEESFSPEYPELLGTLNISYKATIDEQLISFTLEFKDTTEPSIILNKLTSSIKKKTDDVYRRKQIKEEIENNKEELTFEQKSVLVLYLCKFTEDTPDNRTMFCQIYNVENSESSFTKVQLLMTESSDSIYHRVCSIRNKQAIETFISLCCSFYSFLTNEQQQKDFRSLLAEWGYTETESSLLISTAVHKVVIPPGTLEVPATPFPLSVAEQQKVLWAYLMGELYKGCPEDALSNSQKYSLFASMVSLCYPLYAPNYREDVISYLANYALDINISQKCVERAFLLQTPTDKEKNIEIVKSIRNDVSLTHFAAICKGITDIMSNSAIAQSLYYNLLQDIGLTIDECILIERGHFLEKYDSKTKKENTIKTLNQEDKSIKLFLYSWSLVDFLAERNNGIEVKMIVNMQTGFTYNACVLTDDKDFPVTLILPKYIEDMPVAEIKEQNEYLQVGITSKGNFCLYDEKLTEQDLSELGI